MNRMLQSLVRISKLQLRCGAGVLFSPSSSFTPACVMRSMVFSSRSPVRLLMSSVLPVIQLDMVWMQYFSPGHQYDCPCHQWAKILFFLRFKKMWTILKVFIEFVTTSLLFSVSSAAQSCPTLCNPMDCSPPGFRVLHHLPEFAQIHVHWVGDPTQPSHLLF